MTSLNEKANCKRKVRFGSSADAEAALRKINPSKALKKPSRAYKCTVCGGYHLTTQPKAR